MVRALLVLLAVGFASACLNPCCPPPRLCLPPIQLPSIQLPTISFPQPCCGGCGGGCGGGGYSGGGYAAPPPPSGYAFAPQSGGFAPQGAPVSYGPQAAPSGYAGPQPSIQPVFASAPQPQGGYAAGAQGGASSSGYASKAKGVPNHETLPDMVAMPELPLSRAIRF